MQQHKKSIGRIRILNGVRLIRFIAGLLPARAWFLRVEVWQICSFRFHASQMERPPLEFSVILGELLDLDKLICANIQKTLFRIARRPPNLQPGDFRGLAQPNMLLKR